MRSFRPPARQIALQGTINPGLQELYGAPPTVTTQLSRARWCSRSHSAARSGQVPICDPGTGRMP